MTRTARVALRLDGLASRIPSGWKKLLGGSGWLLAVLGPVLVTVRPSMSGWFIAMTVVGVALVTIASLLESRAADVEIGKLTQTKVELDSQIADLQVDIEDLQEEVVRAKAEQAVAMGRYFGPIADVFLAMASQPQEAHSQVAALQTLVMNAASDTCSDEQEKARSVLFTNSRDEPQTLRPIDTLNGPRPSPQRTFTTRTDEGRAVWARLREGQSVTYRDLEVEAPPHMSRTPNGRNYRTFTSSPIMIGLAPALRPVGMLNVDRLAAGTLTDEDEATVSVLAQFYAAGRALESLCSNNVRDDH